MKKEIKNENVSTRKKCSKCVPLSVTDTDHWCTVEFWKGSSCPCTVPNLIVKRMALVFYETGSNFWDLIQFTSFTIESRWYLQWQTNVFGYFTACLVMHTIAPKSVNSLNIVILWTYLYCYVWRVIFDLFK